MLLGHAVGGMCDVMIQDHPMGIKMGFARPFMASDVTSCLNLDKIQALKLLSWIYDTESTQIFVCRSKGHKNFSFFLPPKIIRV